MTSMFEGTTSFNQNISSWNVDNVTEFQYFNRNSALTTGNSPNFDTAP